MQGTRYLGELVRTQGAIQEIRATTRAARYSTCPAVRMPTASLFRGLRAHPSANLDGLRKATPSRYRHRPPILPGRRRSTTGYELLVAGINDIVAVDRPPAVPQPVIASGITVILLVGFFLWSRERRLRSQRQRLRRTYKLGEEILGASSAGHDPEEDLRGAAEHYRRDARALYVYNRTAKTLDAIEDEGGRSGIDFAFLAARRHTRPGPWRASITARCW